MRRYLKLLVGISLILCAFFLATAQRPSIKPIYTKLNDILDVNFTTEATGDIIYYDGTHWVRLAKGTNGQVFTLAAGLPSWATTGAPGAHAATHEIAGADLVDHDNLTNYLATEHFLQSAITQVGTIATGVWNGTVITVPYGGSGRSTSTTAYGLLAAGTTATGAHQTLAAGLTTQIFVGGGAAALPAWGTDVPTAVTIGGQYIYRVGGTDVAVADGGTGGGVAGIGLFNNITGYTATGTTGTTSTNLVFSTSPTFITPALGTPSGGVLTNCTGLPMTTGVIGILPIANGGTNASTSSITSFNNITGYTASGSTGTTSTNLVFSTSPTLVTPALGTPASGVATNLTGLPLTTGVTGTLPVANGGTNITSYAIGDLLYASTTGALSRLADMAAGQALMSGGVGVAPAWDASPSFTGLVSSVGLTTTNTITQTMNSDTTTISHDGADAYFDTSDGAFIFQDDIHTTAYNIKDTIWWVDCFDHGATADRYNKHWDVTSLNTQGNGDNDVDTTPSDITLTTDNNGVGDNEGTRTEYAISQRARRNRSEIEVDLRQTANTQFYFGWNTSGTNAMVAAADEYVIVFFDVSDDANWQIKVGDGTDEEIYTSTTAGATGDIIHCIWVETDGTVHWSINGTEEDITGSISSNKMTASNHYLIVGQAQSVTGVAEIEAEIDYIENEKYK